VSGSIFRIPSRQYFAVGKIDRDQLADYAKRRLGYCDGGTLVGANHKKTKLARIRKEVVSWPVLSRDQCPSQSGYFRRKLQFMT
jgi:hypothetical protein